MKPRIDLFSGPGYEALKALQRTVVAPTPNLIGYGAEVQRALNEIRFHMPMAERFSQAAIGAAFRDLRPLLQDSQYFQSLCQSIAQTNRLLPGVSFDLKLQEMFKAQELLARFQIQPVSYPFEVIADSLASLKAAMTQATVPPYLVTEAAQLPAAYVPYANRQLKRIANADSDQEAEGASVVLEHASAILSEGSVLAAEALSIVTVTEDAEPTSLGTTSRYNIFSGLAQHVGGRYKDLPPSELEQAIESTPPAIINRLGTEIARLITALCQGNNPPIKPTGRAMEAVLNLPNVLASDAYRFGDVMDCIYWTLWEAAGTKDGPLYAALSAPLREVLDALVALRHYCRHSNLIPKNALLVDRLFQRYIGRPVPVLSAQWKKVQKGVYEDVLVLLQEACQAL